MMAGANAAALVGDRVLVDLPAQPAVQVRGIAGQLVAVSGPDEVGFGLRLVLPADDDFPILERAHPSVQIEGFWEGQAFRGHCFGGVSDAVADGGEKFIPADSGQ